METKQGGSRVLVCPPLPAPKGTKKTRILTTDRTNGSSSAPAHATQRITEGKLAGILALFVPTAPTDRAHNYALSCSCAERGSMMAPSSLPLWVLPSWRQGEKGRLRLATPGEGSGNYTLIARTD